MARSRRQPLRRPPPPFHRRVDSTVNGLTDSQLNTVPTTKRNEEEANSEVKNGRYYLRSSKRLNFLKTNINSLPDDIVFDILAQLPAEDIYSAVMPVCHKWYQMIHTHKFVNTHLHRSTYGLLIQNEGSLTTQLTFMALSRQGRVELTRLNYKPRHEIWCSSCNGLILESKRGNCSVLFITNPATMQHFALPPFYGHYSYSAMAYASVSMEYKVVRLSRKEKQWCFAILTVGVDESWRPVRSEHLSHESNRLLVCSPLTTEGFVHWAGCGNYVLTMNVETEIITEYLVPSLFSGDIISSYYFSAVKYLSLLIMCKGSSWKIWEMKPETGEWTELPGIDVNDLGDRVCDILRWLGKCDRKFKSSGCSSIALQAVGWLEYKEVLVCRVYSPALNMDPRFGIAWNVRSKEIQFIELDINKNAFLVHRNSLLWLDGC